MNNYSLVAVIQTPLPPVPGKTPPITYLPFLTPVPKIAAASVGTLSADFLSLSKKFQLNSLLNRK